MQCWMASRMNSYRLLVGVEVLMMIDGTVRPDCDQISNDGVDSSEVKE